MQEKRMWNAGKSTIQDKYHKTYKRSKRSETRYERRKVVTGILQKNEEREQNDSKWVIFNERKIDSSQREIGLKMRFK